MDASYVSLGDSTCCGPHLRKEAPGLVGCFAGAISCGVGVGIGCWPSRILGCVSNGALAGALGGSAALISLIACSIELGVRCPCSKPSCLKGV